MIKLSHEDVLSQLPGRDLYAHKGDFGRVLLLCGSVGYTGAAYLSAMGALRCGSGLVYLGVPESIYEIEAIKLAEAIVFPLPEQGGKLSKEAVEHVAARLNNIDAVLIGPGLGVSEGTLAVTQYFIRNFSGPVVIDADGINLLSAHKDILRGRTSQIILTPHAGEFARFSDKTGNDRVQNAVDTANEYDVIMLLKGHETIITDGKTVYANPTGNPGMAVGGSGDVLAGMIVSFLGQGICPLKAAAFAAWLHGAAGDLCAEQIGQYGMLPSDMLNVLPRLLK